MLTCSATPASLAVSRCTLVKTLNLQNFQQQQSLLSLSSKSPTLNLRKCVHKWTPTMTQQPSFQPLRSYPLFVGARQLRQSALPIQTSRRKWNNTSHSCLLNLNRINFHYINSSIVIHNAIHHHCFHQSITAATLQVLDERGTTNNKPFEDTLKQKLELFKGDKLKVREDTTSLDENEESLKDHVWETGPEVIPTFNVGAYANDSENAKKLVLLGVDLSQWESRYGTIPILYKYNFNKKMQPIISLLQSIGVEGDDLSHVLTENPFIFNEDVRNLKKRIEYLRLKNFSDELIINVIARNPYWLSYSVPRIDRRLGFYQSHFALTGDQVRKLASAGTSGPKLITYHLGRVKDVTFTIKEEMGFTSKEIVKLLLTRPRIWKEVPATLRRRFDYLHNEEKFPHSDFIRCPLLFLQRERRMKERIGFLKELGCAQFDPTKPNYISVEKLCVGNDAEFATDVAKVGAVEFNNYLKTL